MLSAEYVRAGFGSSPAYCVLAALIGVAASAALALSSLTLALKCALGLAVVLTLLDACRRHGWRSVDTAVVLLSGAPDTLMAEYRSGESSEVRLCRPLVVTDRLVVMTLKEAGGRRYRLPIFADAMDAGAFRRLKVYLRLANHAAGSDQP